MLETGSEKSRAGLERIGSYSYLLSIAICGCLAIWFGVSYTSKAGAGENIAVEDKVNINTDPAESIVRLGGIGPVRAADIVEYRDKLKQASQFEKAFNSAQDLDKIKGIGPKTIEKIENEIRY
jgi:competence ComEA-like helix-hairpin-helix protein